MEVDRLLLVVGARASRPQGAKKSPVGRRNRLYAAGGLPGAGWK